MVICRGAAVRLVSVYADRVPRRNERALRPYRSREINTEHENDSAQRSSAPPRAPAAHDIEIFEIEKDENHTL